MLNSSDLDETWYMGLFEVADFEYDIFFFSGTTTMYWSWPPVNTLLDTQLKRHHSRFALLLYRGHVTGFTTNFHYKLLVRRA